MVILLSRVKFLEIKMASEPNEQSMSQSERAWLRMFAGIHAKLLIAVVFIWRFEA
jgi:hypothetical protein